MPNWVVSHIPRFGDASKSPVGDTASPAGYVVASPNCGICDTADSFRNMYNAVVTDENEQKPKLVFSQQRLHSDGKIFFESIESTV